MSDRASIRGARGTSRGRGGGSGARGDRNHDGAARGGRDGGGGGGHSGREAPAAKKENILDLGKYADKRIIVKFGGGREG